MACDTEYLKRPLRVAHVVPTYWPAIRYGGPIETVHRLCAALAELGHSIDVFTTNVDGTGESDVPTDHPLIKDGVRIRYFPTGFGRRLYRSPAMERAFAKSLSKFDLVHIHAVFLWPGWMAAGAARNAAVPYLVAPRGMLAPDLIARRSRLLKGAWIELIERRTLAEAAAIHVTSKVEAAGLTALGLAAAPLLEIPNGVATPEQPVKEHPVWLEVPRGQRVLYLGRLSWKKGLDILIEAAALAGGWCLIVAGNDEEGLQAELSLLAANRGVGHRIVFLGTVSGAAKWDVLAGADLLVLPSLNENFGNVVVEALAVGTPVVASPTVGVADFVCQHGAGVVCERDPSKLASVISNLLGNAELRRAMGERGQNAVHKHLSWAAVSERMTHVYREILFARKGVAASTAIGFES